MYNNASGFETAASDYESNRPTYPVEAVRFISERARLAPGRTVLDIGAGTGKLTRVLKGYGARVIALDHARGMLLKLRTILPDVPAVLGSAEALPFPADSMNLVTVAQAFHWFSPREALSEMARVLVPYGELALLWNIRDTRMDWVADLERLLKPHRGDSPEWMEENWASVIDSSEHFSPCERWEWPWVRRIGLAEIIGSVKSRSYVALLAKQGQSQLISEVEVVLQRHGLDSDGVLTLPYTTVLYAAKKAP